MTEHNKRYAFIIWFPDGTWEHVIATSPRQLLREVRTYTTECVELGALTKAQRNDIIFRARASTNAVIERDAEIEHEADLAQRKAAREANKEAREAKQPTRGGTEIDKLRRFIRWHEVRIKRIHERLRPGASLSVDQQHVLRISQQAIERKNKQLNALLA